MGTGDGRNSHPVYHSFSRRSVCNRNRYCDSYTFSGGGNSIGYGYCDSYPFSRGGNFFFFYGYCDTFPRGGNFFFYGYCDTFPRGWNSLGYRYSYPFPRGWNSFFHRYGNTFSGSGNSLGYRYCDTFSHGNWVSERYPHAYLWGYPVGDLDGNGDGFSDGPGHFHTHCDPDTHGF